MDFLWISEPFFQSYSLPFDTYRIYNIYTYICIYIYTFRIHFFPVRILYGKRGIKRTFGRYRCLAMFVLRRFLSYLHLRILGSSCTVGKSMVLISTWKSPARMTAGNNHRRPSDRHEYAAHTALRRDNGGSRSSNSVRATSMMTVTTVTMAVTVVVVVVVVAAPFAINAFCRTGGRQN